MNFREDIVEEDYLAAGIRNLICLTCPKCGGALIRECDMYGCEVECLQCGYVMPRSKLAAMVGKEEAEAILRPSRSKRTGGAKE